MFRGLQGGDKGFSSAAIIRVSTSFALLCGGEGGKGMIATDLSLKHFLIQGQVKCYRDNQSALTNCLNKMKDFKLPEVKDSMFDPNDNDK